MKEPERPVGAGPDAVVAVLPAAGDAEPARQRPLARLAIVVPATDDPPTLGRCLAAIARAADGPDEVEVVRGPAGAGPAAARNLGVARTTEELVVFVDADVEVHPDAFTRIRVAFAADPRLAAVFGSYDDAPDAPGVVSRFRNLLHHHVHQGAAGPAETFWSGLGAVRRDAFDEVGGFDAERYPGATIEDIDLGMRLHARGLPLRLDPAIQGTHLKRWTLRGMIRTDFAGRGVPWVALMLRRRHVPAGLNLGWRHRLSALASLAALAGLVTRRPAAAGAGALGLVALGRPFYRLLRRRGGTAEAAAGVGLHALHHLVGVAAVPAGVVAHLRGRAS